MTGVTTLLVILFFILKLVGVNPIDDWSWWMVFSPWLVELGIAVVAGVILGIVRIFSD
ncbi:membrane protein [Mycobacterium phage Reindeer]|uniref:Membrane protein n=1 Tax=Mycobacterium phage Reindeer TaxID=2762283 RepID=A0A7G8LHZ3_9CAUD|nr:membrane protein [Mycobacterium phage Reindeer]QNJ56865.1 membrane protein [Mycobacterium phage Reindeer]